MPVILSRKDGGSGGGGGPPSGPAGGDLSGTYPNPDIAALAVGSAEIAALAVTSDKIATGAVTADKIDATSFASGKVHRTAGNFATASATFVDMTGMTITITTGARRVLVTFTSSAFHSAGGGASGSTDLNLDGTRIGGAEGLVETYFTTSLFRFNAGFSWVSDVLSAASHTFKIQVKVSGGTGTWQADTNVPSILSVVELPSA